MEERKLLRRFYILNTEPLKNEKEDYRFGLMKSDFDDLKPYFNQINSVEVKFHKERIKIESALKTYLKYGKLVNPKISDWIKQNNIHLTEKGHPTKIIFELKIRNCNVKYFEEVKQEIEKL